MTDDAELAGLRLEVATGHGLGPEAAKFLDGGTVEEIEAQAGHLAELLGASRRSEPEQGDPLTALFANAGAEKQRRERQLIRALQGQLPQARDQRGRYAARPSAGGIDAGARTTAPPSKGTPEEEHGRWLTGVLLSRAADRGAFF